MLSGKPLIGVTPGIDYDKRLTFTKFGYCEGILEAGGIPVVLPVSMDDSLISGIYERVDGILLAGGVDIDPFHYGETAMTCNGEISPERDYFEISLARMAVDGKKPVMGICRGCQILNVAAGGTLFQDIHAQNEERAVLEHSQKAPRWYGTHEVGIKANSLLFDILESSTVRTNSFHHQAVKDVAGGFFVSAVAPDGIIECIEHVNHPFCLGIQWHPELMWGKDRLFLKPFERLVEMCL